MQRAYLCDELELAPAELINLEYSLGLRTLAKEDEAGAQGDPPR